MMCRTAACWLRWRKWRWQAASAASARKQIGDRFTAFGEDQARYVVTSAVADSDAGSGHADDSDRTPLAEQCGRSGFDSLPRRPARSQRQLLPRLDGKLMADLYLKALESERKSLWATCRLKGLRQGHPRTHPHRRAGWADPRSQGQGEGLGACSLSVDMAASPLPHPVTHRLRCLRLAGWATGGVVTGNCRPPPSPAPDPLDALLLPYPDCLVIIPRGPHLQPARAPHRSARPAGSRIDCSAMAGQRLPIRLAFDAPRASPGLLSAGN